MMSDEKTIEKAIKNAAASVEMEGYHIDETEQRVVPSIAPQGDHYGGIYCSGQEKSGSIF